MRRVISRVLRYFWLQGDCGPMGPPGMQGPAGKDYYVSRAHYERERLNDMNRNCFSTTKQEKAFNAIRDEREYQDEKWGSKASSGCPGNGNRTLDEFVLYVHGLSMELAQFSSHSDNAGLKLDRIRKVAALCVAAMEQHGVVERIMEPRNKCPEDKDEKIARLTNEVNLLKEHLRKINCDRGPG